MADIKNGIGDPNEFYREKFAGESAWDFTGDPFNSLDINNFKFIWIFSHVKPGSRVLDFGCGTGTLACLKRKGCEITGLDLSASALKTASEINVYDRVFCSDIFHFDHEKEYFDYIVSLDVFGHIPFNEKERVIEKLKEYLKPGGSMLHGIECGNVDYESMSREEFQSYVQVDGHVGIEGKEANISRFGKFFRFVQAEVRFDTLNSVDVYRKLDKEYDESLPPLFSEFINLLDFREGKIFDMANGMAMIRQEDLKTPSNEESGGFLLLRASDRELEADRIEFPIRPAPDDPMEDGNVFIKGWYPAEKDLRGNTIRSAGQRAFLKFENCRGKKAGFEISHTYFLLTRWKHIHLYITDFNARFLLKRVKLNMFRKTERVEIRIETDHLLLELFCDTSFIPGYFMPGNGDERNLGMVVRNLKIES